MEQVIMSGQSFDKLLNDLKAHITEEIKTMKNVVIEKPLTYQGAADYLGIHTSTLFKRIREGKIPSSVVHKTDGSVYFLPSELHQLIKNS